MSAPIEAPAEMFKECVHRSVAHPQHLVQVLNKLPYAKSEKDFEEMMPWNVKSGLDVADSQARLAA